LIGRAIKEAAAAVDRIVAGVATETFGLCAVAAVNTSLKTERPTAFTPPVMVSVPMPAKSPASIEWASPVWRLTATAASAAL